MKSLRKIVASLLPIVLLTTQQARAQEETWEQGIEVGTNIVCDTESQVELFVTLFDGDAQSTVDHVNEKVSDPTACVVTTVAYLRGPQLATAKRNGTEYKIVRVIVFGVVTDAGLQPISPAAYFSLFKVEGIDV